MEPALIGAAKSEERAVDQAREPALALFVASSSLEHIIGESVSAMKPETITAPASVKANSRKSAPVTPETKPIGA